MIIKNKVDDIYNYGFAMFRQPARIFNRLFNRTVVAVPTAEGWQQLRLPVEMWVNGITPYLRNRRDLFAFSCCCRATHVICNKAIRIVNLDKLGLINKPREASEIVEGLLKSVEKRSQNIEIIFGSIFDVKLLTNVLDKQYPDLYQNIIGLNFSEGASSSDDVLTIITLLQKVSNLQTLSFGEISRGWGADNVRLDLSQCSFPNLVCLTFKGRIYGRVTFPQQLDNLEELLFKAYILNGGTVDLSQCTFQKLKKLSVVGVMNTGQLSLPAAFNNLENFYFGVVSIDLSQCVCPSLREFTTYSVSSTGTLPSVQSFNNLEKLALGDIEQNTTVDLSGYALPNLRELSIGDIKGQLQLPASLPSLQLRSRFQRTIIERGIKDAAHTAWNSLYHALVNLHRNLPPEVVAVIVLSLALFLYQIYAVLV